MVRKKRVSTQQSASARLASVKTEVREQVTVKFEPLEDGQILESLSRHPEEWENAEASDIAAVDEIVSLRNTRQRKRSHSRRPESSLGLGGGLDNGNGVDSNERIKRTKRDRSPELTITIVDEVPEPIVPIERPAVVKAPLMQQENYVDPISSVSEAPDGHGQTRRSIPSSSMRRDGSSNSTGICTDISGAWLLDPAVSSKAGMVVTVHGSRTLQHGVAWHGGDYEGARGVVLSVHNTGSDDEFFPSTARVKFFKPLNPAVDTFAVPVSLLWPVRPEAEGEHALIIGGPYKGNEARLLEEVSRGWFVSAAYDYFEVTHEDLVKLVPSES